MIFCTEKDMHQRDSLSVATYMSLPDDKLQHLISKQGVCKNLSVYIMKVLLCLSPLMFCTAMLSVCAVQPTSSTSYSKQNVCKTYICTLHLIVGERERANLVVSTADFSLYIYIIFRALDATIP